MNLHNSVDVEFRELVRVICDVTNAQHSSKLLRDAVVSGTPPKKWFPESEALTALEFADHYMLSKLLSKWKGWRVAGVDPRRAALDGWYADESTNLRTNKRLLGLKRGTGYPGSDLTTVISTAQHHISSALGRFDVRKVLDKCRWGPGATQDLPKGTFRDKKISEKMSSTVEALPYMKILIESDPNWIEAITGVYPSGPVSLVKDFWKITDSSRFTTVPKDWDVDRGIDMQPTANGYLQQGVGQYLRTRLRRVGIDLDSQEENQHGALLAHFAFLATLDLKSASDSVTVELVSLLVPPDWCDYLFKLRTKFTQFGHHGPKVKTEKFSAMGNAFTFELETLLFWGLCKAVCELEGVQDSPVYVYGDDLIVDRKAYDSLVYVLNYCGFRVNSSKSFSDGHFYESCGKHYHSMMDVTPIYQKSVVNSPEECIRFHNRLVRWADRIHGDPWRFAEVLVRLQALFFDLSNDFVRKQNVLPMVPLSAVNDDGFLVDEESIARDNNGGFTTFVWRRAPRKNRNLRQSCYLQLKLNNPSYSNGSPEGYPEEEEKGGRYRLSRAYFYR